MSIAPCLSRCTHFHFQQSWITSYVNPNIPTQILELFFLLNCSLSGPPNLPLLPPLVFSFPHGIWPRLLHYASQGRDANQKNSLGQKYALKTAVVKKYFAYCVKKRPVGKCWIYFWFPFGGPPPVVPLWKSSCQLSPSPKGNTIVVELWIFDHVSRDMNACQSMTSRI